MALGVRRLRELFERAGDMGAPTSLDLICLACGAELARALASGGALRCHDCSSSRAPLDAALVELQRVLSGRQRSSE